MSKADLFWIALAGGYMYYMVIYRPKRETTSLNNMFYYGTTGVRG